MPSSWQCDWTIMPSRKRPAINCRLLTLVQKLRLDLTSPPTEGSSSVSLSPQVVRTLLQSLPAPLVRSRAPARVTAGVSPRLDVRSPEIRARALDDEFRGI